MTFEGSDGDNVRIAVQNTGGPFDPRLELVDPAGKTIENRSCDGGCCGGVSCGFTVDKALEATGTYYILISDAGTDESGGYVVSLQCLVGMCEIPGRIPGDGNADGQLDVADGVFILSFLFGGTTLPLPCGDGLDHPGNLALIDWQDDGTINITDGVALLNFLFTDDGPPHTLADPIEPKTTLVEIPDCP